MENKSRKPFLNLIYTICHWILADILCVISMVVQFSFMKDLGETYPGLFGGGTLYEINYLMFVLGTALFLAGFYIIWEKCLLVDWNAFSGKNFLWKAVYLIIALVSTGVIFVEEVLGIFLVVGFTDDIWPEWTTWGFVWFPVYVMLMLIIGLFRNRIAKKYPIDKGLKRYLTKIPFFGWICKMTHKPMDMLLSMVRVPNGLNVRNISIAGFQGEPIKVKEIIPMQPTDGAILVLHGGGFGYKTSPHQFLNACEYAKTLHCRAYLPDYHLLPDYSFPAAYEDAMATYRYMISHAKELGIHVEKIIVLGDSAGGALAANICNRACTNGLPSPCCQVLIYPVTDDTMQTESMNRFTDTPMWNAKNNKRMWEMYLKRLTDEEIGQAVPIKNPKPEKLPPTYIETAEFDCLRDEAIMYAEHIRGIAECIEVYETKGTVHGYDIAAKHPIVKESMNKRIKFMEKCL